MLCGAPNDPVVPFDYTTRMQAVLGNKATTLQISEDELARAAVAFPELDNQVHSLAGTLCIAKELAYFEARR
jgi:hypothetical protein